MLAKQRDLSLKKAAQVDKDAIEIYMKDQEEFE